MHQEFDDTLGIFYPPSLPPPLIDLDNLNPCIYVQFTYRLVTLVTLTHEYHRLYVTALIEGLHLHEAIIRSDLTAVEGILKARVDVNLKYKVRLDRVFHALSTLITLIGGAEWGFIAGSFHDKLTVNWYF